MFKNLSTGIILLVAMGLFFAWPALAGNLIKSGSSPAVYYLDENNVRHLFPVAAVYKTWYRDYSGVKILSLSEITKYPLGKNIPVRAGLNLVSFETDANIYGVEPGGVLRHLASPEVIGGIYGQNWPQRLIKLPDVLFGDYQRGEDINEAVDLPDGLVYKLASDEQYYYKKNNLLWPFKNLKAIADNNFKLVDIVSSNIEFNKRKKPIVGFDGNVFNPAEAPFASASDCENKKFKVAFALAAEKTPAVSELEKINKIKSRLAENFKWASRDLASVDVSYQTVVLTGDDYLFYADSRGQKYPDNEAINIFYDRRPDAFDFIIFYNDFVPDEPEVANYLKVNNGFLGTGNAEMNSSYLYGGRGKLKGLVNMGNLNKYSVENEDATDQTVNYILHELLHHWSARARFKTAAGQISADLLAGAGLDHWSKYTDFVSPVGGAGWVDNGDGTFTNGAKINSSLKKKFSDLDLYFMGLLPKPFVGPIKYLVPESGSADNVIKAKIKEVTLDQITEAMGDWNCRP